LALRVGSAECPDVRFWGYFDRISSGAPISFFARGTGATVGVAAEEARVRRKPLANITSNQKLMPKESLSSHLQRRQINAGDILAAMELRSSCGQRPAFPDTRTAGI